jgi:hypothetical protein
MSVVAIDRHPDYRPASDRERRRRQHSDPHEGDDAEVVSMLALWARRNLAQTAQHSRAVGLMVWRRGLAPHPDDLLAHPPMELQ